MHTSVPEMPVPQQETLWQGFASQCRRVMSEMINQFMQWERELFLGCRPYERSAVRRGYRNGYQPRPFDSQWGPLELRVPKVRNTAEPFRSRTLEAYRRRQRQLERCLVQWVAGGLSTRAVGQALHQAFGATLSPTTVSRIVAEVDAEMARFRQRPLPRGFRYVYLDGKHGKRWLGRARRRRGRVVNSVLLLAWGIGHDGRESLIDFQVAPDESEASWDRFLRRLRQRGVVQRNPWDERLERIVTDGHGGLAAALAMNYPETPHQICVFHKIHNLTDHLHDRWHRAAITRQAAWVFEAPTRAAARARLQRWRRDWEPIEPEAVRNFLRDEDKMLLFYEAPLAFRQRLKTNNVLERFIKELNRKFRQVGVFANAQSWERLTFILYQHRVHQRYAPLTMRHPFTPNS